TRCSVTPGSSWYSAAVLSSTLSRPSVTLPVFLLPGTTRALEGKGRDVHLLPAVDEPLLHRGNPLLLLHLLLDLRYLFAGPALLGRVETRSHRGRGYVGGTC